MAHYFDDIFHRHVNPITRRPSEASRARRSSVGRSISFRSDFDGPANDAAATGDSGGSQERSEADARLHSYISEQLERLKEDGEGDAIEDAEDLETQAW